MPPYVPPQVAETNLSRRVSAVLGQPRRGKVRDTYNLPDHLNHMLVVTTDRISVFDFVLGATVPRKGEVLTAQSVWWVTEHVEGYVRSDLCAYGDGIDEFLPSRMRSDDELQRRATIVELRSMIPYEYIVRGYLTGNGWKSYQKDGTVWGQHVAEGYQDGSKLATPLFTPTTKAEEGHDEPVVPGRVMSEYHMTPVRMSLAIYDHACRVAAKRGIIIADTKFEWGTPDVLCDEVLTSDSSRIWMASEWKEAQREGHAPAGYDKEPVRQWAKTHGIDKMDAKDPEVQRKVGEIPVPQQILSVTSSRFMEIFQRLTGKDLADFRQEDMRGQ